MSPFPPVRPAPAGRLVAAVRRAVVGAPALGGRPPSGRVGVETTILLGNLLAAR